MVQLSQFLKIAEENRSGSEIKNFRGKIEIKDLWPDGVLEPVSFSAYKGEILGLSGQLGSGAGEILASIAGALKSRSGSLTLNGQAVGTSVSTFDTYIRKTFVKKASGIISNSTASFTAVTASAPTGLTSTNEDDFVFFLNGQYMEHDALQIQQTGATFLLKVDTDSIGYFLESDDEIIAQGKFNA